MSANRFKFKRGTTAKVAAYLPQQGEPVYDTDTKELRVGDGTTAGGVPVPNVGSAAKWTTPRTITVSGAVTGSVAIDGSADVGITAVVGSTLQATLDSKAPLASPTLTGVPLAPTAAPGTNTTQLATTAFVDAARVVLVAADALKAPLASPALTGIPTAPTAAVGTNTTQVATMAAIQARILGTVSQSAGVPTGAIVERGSNANGEYVKYADGTLIQKFVVASQSIAVTNAYGSFFYGPGGSPLTWTYPIPFVGTLPDTSLTPYGSARLSTGVLAGAPTLTQGSYVVVDGVLNTTNYLLIYSAIGRWF
ncbi:Phage tail fiber protein [Pseudomonas phage GP100]|nr:Phage tail fiber protein [Pseudomonas phage GP100]